MPATVNQRYTIVRRWTAVAATCLLILLTLLIAGCGGSKSGKDAAHDGLHVVTTTAMIADAARNVGGDFVQVTALMGPGTDPHLYTATAGDVTSMQRADLILYNGLHLEGKMGEVLEGVGRTRRVAPVAEAVPEELLLQTEFAYSNYDPHVWFDPQRWTFVVRDIERVLTEMDPDNAARYAANATAYADSLAALHAWAISRVDKVPADKRVLITAHDAFAYFADAYGFEVHGLQGISTVSEAGTADIRRTAELIAKMKLPAIFVESSVPAKAIEAVQAAVRSRGAEVAIGGELFSDAMGPEGTPEGTYLGMVRHNVNTIVQGLTGNEEGRHDGEDR